MASDQETRDIMKSFWLEHSTNANNQEMMLDTNADKVMAEEIPEVLSFLPDWTGMRVLELASGIGRFTGSLASRSKTVTAVDFIERFVQQNKENNQDHGNITFLVNDVRDLRFEKDSFDMIFSSWLLLYFTPDETRQLLQRFLSWVKIDGYLFFRESCNKTSANFEVTDNPSIYRPTAEFNQFFRDFVPNTEDDADWHLEIVFARPLLSYVKMKENRHQMCWLLRKRRGVAGVARLPKTLSSPEKPTHLRRLELKPGQRVLDIGCGEGARSFYMEQEYGVDVLGIDPSLEAIEQAWRRQTKSGTYVKVCFEYGDISKRQLPPNYFDAIFVGHDMNDVIDKLALIDKFKTWLKQGGRLMIHEVTDTHILSSDGNSTSKDPQTTMEAVVKVFGAGVKAITPVGQNEGCFLLCEKAN